MGISGRTNEIGRVPAWCPHRAIVHVGVLLAVLIAGSGVAVGETPLTTVRVASGLNQPLYVTHAPGDAERIFIVEQGGRIKILRDGLIVPTPFLNISSRISAGGERGLLGLAFHPQYAENGRFFVNYTDPSGNTVIVGFTISANPDVADAASATRVLRVYQPDANHNGGWVAFGPDGFLYIATGDGGASFDTGIGHTFETGNAQDTSDNLLGKLLRIDVDGDDFPADLERNYAIPPDNPFVGTAGDDEIWSYGLRNPWRCAFDSKTGDLFIADVGQAAWEEINVQPLASTGGENYGWRCMEGSTCTGRTGCTCLEPTLVTPVYEYGHGGEPFRCSISGGEVYRGCAIPDLSGTYFFADFCSNQIWSLRLDGMKVVDLRDRTVELAPGGGLQVLNIASFGRDAFGELYICDLSGGEVFKIVPDALPAALTIAFSHPPDGAIDARQPFEPDGSGPAGWDAVDLVFDGCVGQHTPADFTMSQEGGAEPLPQVTTVERLDGASLRLVLSATISIGAWTTVTHTASGSAITLGRLPGDVDGSGRSDGADLDWLVDVLTGTAGPQPVWSVDTDNSGALAPGDLLRLIDLLNGAEGYEPYRNVTLP